MDACKKIAGCNGPKVRSKLAMRQLNEEDWKKGLMREGAKGGASATLTTLHEQLERMQKKSKEKTNSEPPPMGPPIPMKHPSTPWHVILMTQMEMCLGTRRRMMWMSAVTIVAPPHPMEV